MMMIFFYMFMMMPLFFFVYSFFFYEVSLMFLFLVICFKSVNFYFSCLSYDFGLDLYSYGFILLSLLISSLMIISSYNYNYSIFLLMIIYFLCFFLMVIFCVLNIFYMYVFFEFSLVPLMIMIIGWGYQPERLLSGIYLFFYTFFGSLPFLIMTMLIYNLNNSLFFDYVFFIDEFIFYLFIFFIFLVKFPMFMLHFWLPKAHVQAPVMGSMILAGLLLSIGGYGFIRFLYMFELSSLKYGYVWYSLSIFGCVILSIVCYSQGDMKCLIAYSSVSHMGMCLMGLLTMSTWGVLGSYFMMIGHGLCSSGMFCVSNIYYERLMSRSFFLTKGMFMYMPSLSFFWFILCMFNMSCPPSVNFISELMIMNSMISYWLSSFYYLVFICFFCSCFSFYLFIYIHHGSFHNMYSYSLCNFREFLMLFIHIFPMIFYLFIMNFFY
nr:NADH dehydrogenase subunit 4 [Tartessus sp.]